MGLDINVKLVLGVQLNRLGTFMEESESKPLFDKWGNRTDRQAILKRVYFVFKDEKHLVWEDNAEYFRGEKDYSYHSIFGDDYTGNQWFHYSDWEGGTDQIIIGKRLHSKLECEHGRWQYFSASSPSDVAPTKEAVQKYLVEKFGYQGEVHLFALAHYSY